MGYIYKIENKINGKVYIGQTRNIRKRWYDHRYVAQHGGLNGTNKLYEHMRLYGVDNFEISVIESCTDSKLTDREGYWIDVYDSTNCEKGYNRKGVRVSNTNSISQYDLDGNLVAIYSGKCEAAKITGVKSQCIEKCCNKEIDYSYGYIWRYSDDDPPQPYVVNKERPVRQYRFDGEFIMEYENTSVAAKETGIPRSYIGSCVYGRSMSAGGYQWRFADEDPPGEYTCYSTLCIEQYDLDFNYIATYNTLSEAASNFSGGTYCSTKISDCCKGKSEEAYGFIWRFSNKQRKLKQVNNHYAAKEIDQYSIDGDYIQTYQSMKEASDMSGVPYWQIFLCCRGKKKSAGNYVWKYANNKNEGDVL